MGDVDEAVVLALDDDCKVASCRSGDVRRGELSIGSYPTRLPIQQAWTVARDRPHTRCATTRSEGWAVQTVECGWRLFSNINIFIADDLQARRRDKTKTE